jgi:hypothetical protein
VTAALGWRSSVRRSMTPTVRQAGQRTHRNQCRAATAAPIVGEKPGATSPMCRKRRNAVTRKFPTSCRHEALSFSHQVRLIQRDLKRTKDHARYAYLRMRRCLGQGRDRRHQ